MIGSRLLTLFVFYLVQFLYHITATGAFQVQCPTDVQAGEATQCTWIRTSGDGSSFGLLLREITQDHGGTLVTTVRNTNKDQDTFEVTFPNENKYLLELVRNLDPVPSTEVPQILASSSTITAAKSAGQPGSGSGSGSDTSSAGGGNAGGGNTGGGNSGSETSRPETGQTHTTAPPEPSPSPTPAPPASLPPTPQDTETNQSDSSTSSAAAESVTSASGASDSQSSQSSGKTPGNLFPSPSPTSSSLSEDPGSSNSTSLGSERGSIVSNPSSTGNTSPVPSTTETGTTSATKGSSKLGLILGLTLGLLLLVLILLTALLCFIRRRRRHATTTFYQEKMGGRKLIFSNGSPEGGFGDAFASGVGAGVGGAGALVVSRPATYEKMPLTNSAATVGHQNHSSTSAESVVLDVSADKALAGYAYSVSDYSDRTSKTGSLDSKIVDLWRNARMAISGLTRSRSRKTIQSGYSGDGDGNIVMDRTESSMSTQIRFSVQSSLEPSSSEPSVFYTAVPRPQVGMDGVGQKIGDGIGWVKPAETTFKERTTSPWSLFPSKPPPQAELPTSTVSSWYSNLPETPDRVVGSTSNAVPFRSVSPPNQTLTVPQSTSGHSGDSSMEEIVDHHDSYVSLLGLHRGSGQNYASGQPGREQITPELSSLSWDSKSSSGPRSSVGSDSSVISYPSVSRGLVAYESRTSHGRSDEY